MGDSLFEQSRKYKAKFLESVKPDSFIPFIGEGISASLKIQDWKGLMDHVAQVLGYDEKIFSKLGDYLSLAEYCQLNGKIDILKQWMKEKWYEEIDESRIENSEIYQALVNFKCKRIYTTNYDKFIETAYNIMGDGAVSIVKIDDFIKQMESEENRHKTQVIKLHGDLLSDEPLVLSESSYYDRIMNPSSLDFKLQSDMIDKTFLFLGYSMSDMNIRRIIYMLDNLWKDKGKRPDSYIFLPKPNAVLTRILEERNIHTILGDMPIDTDSKPKQVIQTDGKITKDYRTIMIENFLKKVNECIANNN